MDLILVNTDQRSSARAQQHRAVISAVTSANDGIPDAFKMIIGTSLHEKLSEADIMSRQNVKGSYGLISRSDSL